MPDTNGDLFRYEEIYEFFAAGNRATSRELAAHFGMDVTVARANCNYIAHKYHVPLFSNGGVYAIRWNADESEALLGQRTQDVASRLENGVRIAVDNFVEVVDQLSPGKKEKYYPRLDMFVATCKYLVSQAHALQLEGPKQE